MKMLLVKIVMLMDWMRGENSQHVFRGILLACKILHDANMKSGTEGWGM